MGRGRSSPSYAVLQRPSAGRRLIAPPTCRYSVAQPTDGDTLRTQHRTRDLKGAEGDGHGEEADGQAEAWAAGGGGVAEAWLAEGADDGVAGTPGHHGESGAHEREYGDGAQGCDVGGDEQGVLGSDGDQGAAGVDQQVASGGRQAGEQRRLPGEVFGFGGCDVGGVGVLAGELKRLGGLGDGDRRRRWWADGLAECGGEVVEAAPLRGEALVELGDSRGDAVALRRVVSCGLLLAMAQLGELTGQLLVFGPGTHHPQISSMRWPGRTNGTIRVVRWSCRSTSRARLGRGSYARSCSPRYEPSSLPGTLSATRQAMSSRLPAPPRSSARRRSPRHQPSRWMP